MQISSLNIGKVKHYGWRNGADSAIFKAPVNKSLKLSKTGLEGDEQADLKNHGGSDKAVLIIPEKNYSFFDVREPFGFLGENITLSDTDESQIRLGDQLQMGNVVLEVSQPRSPCWKLGEINGSQMFVKNYSSSGRVGFYCRVLSEGELEQGLDVKKIYSDQTAPSIQRLFLAKHHAPKNDEDWQVIESGLAMECLSEAWRKELQRSLDRKA